MKEKKRRKIRLSIPGIILGILLLIMNITLIVILKLFDIIPDNYYYLIVVVLFIISIIINEETKHISIMNAKVPIKGIRVRTARAIPASMLSIVICFNSILFIVFLRD